MKSQVFQTVAIAAPVALLMALGTAAGCTSSGEQTFEFELVTSPASQAATCPANGAGGLVKTGPEGVRQLRVTFFDAEAGPPSVDSFLCDRLVAADESGTPFHIRGSARSRVHIRVEAFGEAPGSTDATRLIASGTLTDVSLGEKTPPRVFLPMAGRLGCTLTTMATARAFHSATALPGRRALIVGGVVARRGEDREVDEGSGLFLTESVEIYDGESGRFVQPTLVGDPGIRRAFHDAFLMPGATLEQARVLLLGGVGQGEVPEGQGVVMVRQGPQHPFRFTPAPEASPAGAEILTVDFTTDPPTVTRSQASLEGWPARYFQGGASYGQNGACVAGGATGVLSTGEFVRDSGIDLGYPDTGEHYPLAGNLLAPRVGGTLSRLTSATAVAWGGNLQQPDRLGTLAELITLSPAPPSATPLGYDASMSTDASLVPTVFHTATVLEDGDLLLVGGFEIEGNVALNPSAEAPIHRIVMGTDVFTAHGQDATDFVPVGYHAAVKLDDGRVLITGGSPSRPGTQPCITGQSSWTCTLSQAFLYTPDPEPWSPGSLEPLPGDGLVVPRLGHQMVVLDSGVVLVTGGLHRDGETLYSEASAEVLSVATGSATADAPLFREPGALYSTESECPVF